jgi:hypothetical protein
MSQTRINPFSATPDLDDRERADRDLGDPAHPVECGRCGTIHESAREALNCTHTTHE